ncbi:hypothetical protein GQ600_5783 [Phytophthora cactorum]|nr:hypothetical protein GQ600_5783 [Phytophthora cactorum]
MAQETLPNTIWTCKTAKKSILKTSPTRERTLSSLRAHTYGCWSTSLLTETHEVHFIDAKHTETLECNTSFPLQARVSVSPKASAPTTTSFNYSDAALAASEAAAAEEIRRRQRVEAELAEAKSAAQAKDRERLDAQIQAKQDAQRAQELELARNEQVYARSLLEAGVGSPRTAKPGAETSPQTVGGPATSYKRECAAFPGQYQFHRPSS